MIDASTCRHMMFTVALLLTHVAKSLRMALFLYFIFICSSTNAFLCTTLLRGLYGIESNSMAKPLLNPIPLPPWLRKPRLLIFLSPAIFALLPHAEP